MKLKRLLSTATAVAMACTVMAGCSGTGSSGKQVITIWSSDRSEMDVRQKQIDQFNATHDDIEIKYEVKADNYSDTIKIACESGTAPDIFSYDPNLVRSGYVKPLDDELTQKFEEVFLPGALRYPTDDGEAYGVALKDVGFKLIWNKDLFKEAGLDPEQPPKTWSEVLEYAKKITAIGDGVKYGFALPLKNNAFIQYYVVLPSAVDGNYNLTGYDPHTASYSFDCYKPMLEVMRELKNAEVLFPSPGTLDNDTARAMFSAGNVGIMLGASWDVGVFNDQFPAECDWGVTDMPSIGGEVKGGHPFGYGGNAFSMNADSKNPEAQKVVYEWLHSEEILKELSLAGKGPFVMKSLQGEEFIPDDKKGAKEFAQRTEPYVIIDSMQDAPVIKLEGDTVYKVFADAIISELDFDEAINDLNTRYNTALNKFFESEKKEGRDPERFKKPDFDYSKGQ